MEKFDFNKIEDFDKHINLSIPNYDWLMNQILTYSQYFIQEGTRVIDLGCSTGNLLMQMPRFKDVEYIGVDNSNLLPVNDYIKFVKEDLGSFDNYKNSMFITSVFTLQFLSNDVRRRVLGGVKEGLRKGGAFIVCEKTYSETPKLQDITNSMYYEFKENNFRVDEILLKERELRSSLRLKTLDEIIEELRLIGSVEIFWRSFNFVGFIVIK